MALTRFGKIGAPALVCVPGLLGGPEDFRGLLPALEDRFDILLLDPNAERREQGLLNLTEETVKEISYASTASDIQAHLDELNHESAYFLGVSLGGKVVYDFAIRYPQNFLGAVITDVGVDPFEDAELFQKIFSFVKNAPLHLPWEDMKQVLRQTFDDRNLRSLIQTQLSYPDRRPPAIWKTGMANFGSMLKSQKISHQYKGLLDADTWLADHRRFIHVLHASRLSGISADCYRKMLDLRSVRIHSIQNSTHFLHVTHKEKIAHAVLNLLNQSDLSTRLQIRQQEPFSPDTGPN